VIDRIEHQRDPGQRLHGTVVEEERKPPAFVLLGCDPLLEQADAIALVLSPLALSPLERRLCPLSQ
jgi:hypothetical protein